MTRFVLSFITIIALLMGNSAHAQTNSNDQVRQAIEDAYAQYIKSFAEADAAGVASVYDENGSRLYSGGKVIQGRDAIKADVEGFVKKVGPVTVSLETLDLWVIDDNAYEAGKWSYTYQPPGQNQKTSSGRYLTVWKRQKDGNWKMFADISLPQD